MRYLLFDFRYALRQFRLAPVFTASAVLTLALGIGGTTAIFTLIHAVMLRSLPVSDPATLYRVGDGNDCCVESGSQGFWPQGKAIGGRINLCSLDPKPCWITIVGIVGNVHQFGLDAAPTYDVYFSGGWTPNLIIRTVSGPQVAIAAAHVIHKIDPMLPVAKVMTMDELLAGSVAPRRYSAILTGIFAVLALLLAAVGIYGVMSYMVGRRTSEIGIRMALGAQPRDVLRLVVAHGVKLALIGVALGICGSLALARLISSLLFGVRATDPVTFGAVVVLLTSVAIAACYIPARRAMKVDPMVALRYE